MDHGGYLTENLFPPSSAKDLGNVFLGLPPLPDYITMRGICFELNRIGWTFPEMPSKMPLEIAPDFQGLITNPVSHIP